MSDPDRSRQREHWQAIAEQLGLAPDPSQPCAAPAESDLPPPMPEEEPVAEVSAPAVEREPLAEPAPPRRGRRGRPDQAEKQPVLRERPNSMPRAEAGTHESAAPTGQSEEEGTRRGRRRRSGRSAAPTENRPRASEASAEISDEAEAPDEPASHPKRRGRGRNRSKKAELEKPRPARGENKEPAAEPVAPPGAEREDEELDDVRSLSNWNVPSWNELIASLYRPER